MRIGELAERTGASVRSLRYYEEQELLLADRTPGGQREYDDDAIDRVQLIRLLLAAGVPTSAIVQMLPCIYSGTTTPAMIARLVEERDKIDEQARSLAATLARLDTVIVHARERLAVPA